MTQKCTLFVDDMSSIRQVIAALLKDSGYEAAQASSGAIALDPWKKTKFDLVLSDWNMLGMFGSEFVRATQDLGRLRNTTKKLQHH